MQISESLSAAAPLIASRSVPVPATAGGWRLSGWVKAELRDEESATGNQLYAGLFDLPGRQRLLVMAASQGTALGPAVCRHYQSHSDFLWLESAFGQDESDIEIRWHWCLVRSGMPVVEGTDSPQAEIEQSLAVQTGTLTVIYAEPQARQCLQNLNCPQLELRWLPLESRAGSALECWPRLLPAQQFCHRLVWGYRLRVAFFLALLLVCVSAVLFFAWPQQVADLASAPPALHPPLSPAGADSVAAADSVGTNIGPPLRLDSTALLQAIYIQLIALWARGAAEISVQLDGPILRTEARLPRDQAEQVGVLLRRWAEQRQLQLQQPEPLLLVLQRRLNIVTAADSALSESEAAGQLAAFGLRQEGGALHLPQVQSNPALLGAMARSLQNTGIALHSLRLSADSDWYLTGLQLRLLP